MELIPRVLVGFPFFFVRPDVWVMFWDVLNRCMFSAPLTTGYPLVFEYRGNTTLLSMVIPCSRARFFLVHDKRFDAHWRSIAPKERTVKHNQRVTGACRWCLSKYLSKIYLNLLSYPGFRSPYLKGNVIPKRCKRGIKYAKCTIFHDPWHVKGRAAKRGSAGNSVDKIGRIYPSFLQNF